MAGAFGYAADTIDVSSPWANCRCLPAVRKAPADALIVADGTSCRQQIHDGAGREALHVARVLAMACRRRDLYRSRPARFRASGAAPGN